MLSSTALANDTINTPKVYLGATLGFATYEESAPDTVYRTEHTLVGLRAGAKFNQFISAEFRVARGSEEAETIQGIYSTFEIEMITSLLIRGHIPLNANTSIYGAIGQSKVNGTIKAFFNGPSSDYIEASGSEKDTSLGLGIEYVTNHKDKANFGFGAEYLQYGDSDEQALGGINVTAFVQF